ncbi:MAG TPA: UDP-N-acetylmuramate dehydrogenase, partial [Exiguobacterium sp.]|nr:UDP-N-acetylmuramate dehydrogenase [Exiguobacterium sp.]
MDDLTHKRETKQPLEYPSCGSVFKRPEGYFAGKLIQDSELQGTRIGGAEVSKKHAGFIVNVENASASDYIALIRHVQETVQEKFGILLETEVKIIGEEA